MTVSLSFAGESLVPLACGGLYWPAQQTLLVADLHLEKASHFARRGWMLPPHDTAQTLAMLIDAVEATGARRLVCLGDSFHDRHGPGRMPDAARGALTRMIASLDWWWITGNHDDASAGTLGGRAVAEVQLGPLMLRHEAEPGDIQPEISGHFHPKVRIATRLRAITRRCFAVSGTKIIMPAYGALAGGLDCGDPAIARALAGPGAAVVREGSHLLSFPIAALQTADLA
ncbi:ligase-associated DNA damage response endonuclease PdeM [Sandarakinorhabdus sp.]|uniref:ligase-associated DNA damage response endonuclease PdeM n=1 Tax=Sandarakinorhabdus sp. TaxID=1916663 RepID=UPI00286E7400|nr:ligase-associated DNA damage response endonuclease PdeM [Sandarakinorhabdus sp.]